MDAVTTAGRSLGDLECRFEVDRQLDEVLHFLELSFIFQEFVEHIDNRAVFANL